ncbi:MAG: cytochrome c biogenesis protein ResB [Desulfobulbaceae bacterium]|nr:cytochrome c biogenesis protein ResB [Desulfobulbaceae bacterium]
MTQEQNAIWRFFASVRLALITLFLLALTSIIGTLIPQGKPPAFYIQEYGLNLARFFLTLNIPHMYSSWWFIALLGLFSNNLIVCTIERLPNVWRMVFLDNLDTDPERLAKMELRHQAVADLPTGSTAERLQQILARAGWHKSARRDRGEGIMIFAQQGAWSRFGVYAVHLSILIIFTGAIIGVFFGFKAGVTLSEGGSTTEIYQRGSDRPIPLGFELRCDSFDINYYDNGMPREYRSDLTIIDPARDIPRQESIIVNDPLDYKGLTFYQSNYEPLREFTITLSNQESGAEKLFRISPGQQVSWPEIGISFGIISLTSNREGMAQRIKIWFNDNNGAEPTVFWLGNKQQMDIARSGRNFTIQARQMFVTSLEVVKDPGVFVVYLGCSLLLLGLYVAFFFSHQRLWVYITPVSDENRKGGGGGNGSKILLCGTSNKNRDVFERRFAALITALNQDKTLDIPEVGS